MESTATRAGDAGAAATSAVTTAEETSSALGDGGAAGDPTRPAEHKAAELHKEPGEGAEARRPDGALQAGAPAQAEATAVTYRGENRSRADDATTNEAAQEAARNDTAQRGRSAILLGKRNRSEQGPSLVQRPCKRYKLSRYNFIEVWHGQESSSGVASTGIT